MNSTTPPSDNPSQAMPIFWSFRRCPYAMRARLAVKSSGIPLRLREILLRKKPEEFLAASAKGTVPVLHLPDGTVIDESLDVVFWALNQSDRENWLLIWHKDRAYCEDFIAELDGPFKTNLDRYKYSSRYINDDDSDSEVRARTLKHRSDGAYFIQKLEERLNTLPYLSGEEMGVLDILSLPFIRQFRIADPKWFDAQDWPRMHQLLQGFLNSDRFSAVMEKYPQWIETGEEFAF